MSNDDQYKESKNLSFLEKIDDDRAAPATDHTWRNSRQTKISNFFKKVQTLIQWSVDDDGPL